MLNSLRSSTSSSLHMDTAAFHELAEEDEAPTPREDSATPSENPCAEARLRLRKSIAVHKTILTGTEVEFLKGLVDTTDVAAEDLEHCTKVLERDPLYQRQEEDTKDNEGTDTVDRRPSLLPDTSYRKELWSHLQAECSEESKLIFMTERDCRLSEGKKHGPELLETEPPEPSKKERIHNKWESFVYKFQKAFNPYGTEDKESVTVSEQDDGYIDDGTPTFSVLATSIPSLITNPATVLSPPIMDALRAYLPFAVQHDNFWLKYSMVQDGASMRVLSSKVRNSARTILAIETDRGEVFGSFTSSPWRIQRDGYYGSGEAFLWRLKKSRFTPCASVEEKIQLESDVEVFEWSHNNRNVQAWFGMEGELCVGGGGYDDGTECPDKDFGSGISITGDLSRGFSERCLTFNSPPLTTKATSDDIFYVANIEVWTLTPMDSLHEAERLELSRQFIFDHGGFCEQ